MGTAIINRDVCLAWQGTVCRACWHACPFPNEAIVFDERGRALVVAEQCIGCGICDHACITEPSSITIQPREIA
jgi:Pyruvate/2-oxoacid:ferredoxin oxidoreductase delta subunit